jgi:glycosyltransferase involved in cell wall biosynthesis
VEPRRGIPFARNTAVARALGEGADFIAFIDDDEVPEPSWLDELLHVQRLYRVDVVMGPVLAHFTAPVAPWVEKGGFFHSLRHPTGHPMEWGWTSNVLVRSEVFEKMGKLFDERFALSGGSDRHFFERVRRAGHRMVWADEALVREWVPESRASLGWLLRRRYRLGNTYSTISVGFEPSARTRAGLAADACRYTARSLARLLWRLPRSLAVKRRPLDEVRRMRSPIKVTRPIRLVRPLLRASYAVGMLWGALGGRYEEYRRVHGD